MSYPCRAAPRQLGQASVDGPPSLRRLFCSPGVRYQTPNPLLALVPESFRLKKGAALSLALESFIFLPPPQQLTTLSPKHVANRLVLLANNNRPTETS